MQPLLAQPCSCNMDSHCCTLKREPCCESSPRGVTSVGAVRQDQSAVEAELDDAICELGRKAEAAMADGDPAGAREWTDRMYAAIASRTPEHKARLEAEAMQRADESTFAGEWAMRLAGEVHGR